jgi:biotin synthase-like enzyme
MLGIVKFKKYYPTFLKKNSFGTLKMQKMISEDCTYCYFVSRDMTNSNSYFFYKKCHIGLQEPIMHSFK